MKSLQNRKGFLYGLATLRALGECWRCQGTRAGAERSELGAPRGAHCQARADSASANSKSVGRRVNNATATLPDTGTVSLGYTTHS